VSRNEVKSLKVSAENKMSSMKLVDAIRELDTIAANISKAEDLWSEITDFWPEGASFISEDEFENLVSDFVEIIDALPNIDNWKPKPDIVSPNEIAQAHIDAADVMEWSILFNVQQRAAQPGKELSVYRHRYEKHRARISNARIQHIIQEIDELIIRYAGLQGEDITENADPEFWGVLSERTKEVEALLGRKPNEIPRWSDLKRHISFAEVNDLRDVVIMDWPSVRPALQGVSRRKYDPLPVKVSDLNEIIAGSGVESISTKFSWESIDSNEFERLIFYLFNRTAGYQNVRWLSHTNAPDRGRDLSAERVTTDPLSGTRRERIIIQCKHYLKSSIGPSEVSTTKDIVTMWEPPRVDVLIFATSGRFTADAIKLSEQHNERGGLPRIELWADSHLETLLSSHPGLIADFKLR